MRIGRLVIALFFGCSVFGVAFGQVSAVDRLEEFVRPSHLVFPEEARYTPQITALGKMLFFDPRLSGNQTMACASCHNPSFGWESPVPNAIGAMNVLLARHTPTLENLIEAEHFTWDGGGGSLEEQAVQPITSAAEMSSDFPTIVARLSDIEGYREAFAIAFPKGGITRETLLHALATFLRTVQSGWSPFDEWVAGNPIAITREAKRGFDLFTGKARCVDCHEGWAFTDRQFHDIGLPTRDPGRAGVDPDWPEGSVAFKTPGLRNIVLRAPYMHNGSLATLNAVIAHYNHGGVRDPNRAIEIVPLGLTDAEISDLIAFLETLTATGPAVSAPRLPAP